MDKYRLITLQRKIKFTKVEWDYVLKLRTTKMAKYCVKELNKDATVTRVKRIGKSVFYNVGYSHNYKRFEEYSCIG